VLLLLQPHRLYCLGYSWKKKNPIPTNMKKPTNKEIRACDGSILNIEPMANSQKIAVAKKMVKARPATMKLVLKSLKTHHFFA
jgi:hypothetical protein